MSDDISLEVIKKTQEKLGPFVKKPPLTEKLLKKPPFRFLHDIITAIIKNTDFFEGLFSEDELNSENVKDREKKIIFLQKIIKVINMVTGSSLTVRPSKIISGQEPAKTNELLQKIGEALQQNLNSKEAIKSINSLNDVAKEAQKPSKENTKVVKSEKKNSEPKSKVDGKKKNPQKTEPESNPKMVNKRKKDDEIKKKLPNRGVVQENKSVRSKESKEIKEVSKKNVLIKQNNITKDSARKEEIPKVIATKTNLNDVVKEIDIKNEKNDSIVDTEYLENDAPEEKIKKEDSYESRSVSNEIKINEPFGSLPSDTSSIQNDLLGPSVDDNDMNKEQITKNVSEPISTSSENAATEKLEHEKKQEATTQESFSEKRTRTASSKLIKSRETISKTKSISLEEANEVKIPAKIERTINNSPETRPKTSLRPPSVRPSSSRPGAPRFKNNNLDIITNTTENIPKAKVNIIIENYDNPNEEDDGSVVVEQTIFDDNIVESEFSKSQLDSKVSNVSGHGHLVQQILDTKKELDGESSNVEIEWEWGTKRERETSFKEVETLRNGLQSLSRAANPLGKLMDYVQEDVEIMRQELLNWRQARQSATDTLKHQESLTEKAIQPLEAKLKQLDANIADRIELIYTVKSNIYRNGQKIRKLIDKEYS